MCTRRLTQATVQSACSVGRLKEWWEAEAEQKPKGQSVQRPWNCFSSPLHKAVKVHRAFLDGLPHGWVSSAFLRARTQTESTHCRCRRCLVCIGGISGVLGSQLASLERLVWIFLVKVAGDSQLGQLPRAALPDLTHLRLLTSYLLEPLVSDYWWAGDLASLLCAWRVWAPHLLRGDRNTVAAVCPDPSRCWRSGRLHCLAGDL